MPSTRALDNIATALGEQYNSWDFKKNPATYKKCLDGTPDDIERLCKNLRKHAKQDNRVLFHYNGHGVPKPTEIGELWFFNQVLCVSLTLSFCLFLFFVVFLSFLV